MGRRWSILSEIAVFGKENNVDKEKLKLFAFEILNYAGLIDDYFEDEHDRKWISKSIDEEYEIKSEF